MLHACTLKKAETSSSNNTSASIRWQLLDSEQNGPIHLDTDIAWNSLSGSIICIISGDLWQERAAHADLYTADPLLPFNPLDYGSDSHICIDKQPHPAASENTQTEKKR